MTDNGLMMEVVGEEAVRALGAGFDLTSDFRLRFAKASEGRRLVELGGETRDVPLPGGAGATLRGVPRDVGVDKGDRIRFRSDVLEFNQVRARHPLPFPLLRGSGRCRHPRPRPSCSCLAACDAAIGPVFRGSGGVIELDSSFMRLFSRPWPVLSARLRGDAWSD